MSVRYPPASQESTTSDSSLADQRADCRASVSDVISLRIGVRRGGRPTIRIEDKAIATNSRFPLFALFSRRAGRDALGLTRRLLQLALCSFGGGTVLREPGRLDLLARSLRRLQALLRGPLLLRTEIRILDRVGYRRSRVGRGCRGNRVPGRVRSASHDEIAGK